ncbi:unnamed protein product, partial [marine sediment metagenome]
LDVRNFFGLCADDRIECECSLFLPDDRAYERLVAAGVTRLSYSELVLQVLGKRGPLPEAPRDSTHLEGLLEKAGVPYTFLLPEDM